MEEIEFSEADLELIEVRESDEAYGEIRIYRVRGTSRVVYDEEFDERTLEDLQVCTKIKIFDSKEDS